MPFKISCGCDGVRCCGILCVMLCVILCVIVLLKSLKVTQVHSCVGVGVYVMLCVAHHNGHLARWSLIMMVAQKDGRSA